MKKACVIGWPISHSRSPLIHNYWITQYSLDASFEKQAIPPGELSKFINELADESFVGCNVTIPYKEEVIKFTTPDRLVKRTGSANTIFKKNDILHSTSTDGEGFIQSLRQDVPDLDFKNKIALIIGAGGAARAISGALLDEGLNQILLANRTLERSQQLCETIEGNIKPISWNEIHRNICNADFLINATSLGMKGQPTLDINIETLPRSAIVCDIVYVPLKTKLIEDAHKRGIRTSPGLGMLLYQAVRGFELWFGVRPAVTKELRTIIETDILTNT